MSDDKDQHEPSMEEILASIRRIISEDGEEAPAAEEAPTALPAEAAPAPAPQAPPLEAAPAEVASTEVAPMVPPPVAAAAPKAVFVEDDILLLTDEVHDDPPPPPPAPVHHDAPLQVVEEPEPLSPLQDEPEPEPMPVLRHEPPPPPPAPVIEPEPPARDRLISDHAATASLAALSELVTRTYREPNIESLPMGQPNQTLEDITRELLRPILKAWLDENLPQIVERIVREEIGRLAIDAQRR
jgi:cell pole-organizing protein PopZ